MNRKNLQGFTLVELLIVVVIIGTLAVVALPRYRTAIEKAKVASVLPVMRAIREAQEMYRAEYNKLTCDLADLNISLDNVIEVNTAFGDSMSGVRQRDGRTGRIKSEPGNDYAVSPNQACGYKDGEWNDSKPWYGHQWKLVLPSKDELILKSQKVDYTSVSRQLVIDYHLLGTYGEEAGQWKYSGCHNGYNRCDAVCYARCKDSIWENVCRSLANGKLAKEGATGNMECNSGIPGTLYCIQGGRPQNTCPDGTSPKSF